MKNENVICVPVQIMKKAFGLEVQYWAAKADEINQLSFDYVSRAIAENDFSHKQLIPYAIVQNSEGRVLVYRRCGSEKRLSDIHSCGVGGHVNDKDEGNSLYEKLLAGLKREFEEEIGIQLSDSQIHLLGMINEELSEVGHCHTGVVFNVNIGTSALHFDAEIGDPQWLTTQEIQLDKFELWSSLALRLFNDCAGRKDLTVDNEFVSEIKSILDNARQKAYSAINAAMVEAYWLMGKRIVEEEQQGNKSADYGTQLIKMLSSELTRTYGKGFGVSQIYYYRQFYLTFPKIFHTPCGILSWSHYKRLLSVTNEQARNWYLKESAEEMWSYRVLDRNIASQYYERMLLTHKNTNEPAIVPSNSEATDKLEFIKNPMVAEFIGLAPNADFNESQLETAIITNIEKFLLELGKGFSFVARQRLVRTEKRDYFIDLVFYNYKLKSFVLVDLKTTTVTHQDVGQMDMYVRMYDEQVRGEDDNPTIGIILCAETDNDIARYSVLHDNDHLFASKYMLYMPTQEELRAEIERQKMFFKLQHKNIEE